jgi:hypothetical protein
VEIRIILVGIDGNASHYGVLWRSIVDIL